MMTAFEDVENVAESGSLGGGDDADARRQGWDRVLALSGEETFGFELSFELLEGQLKGSSTFGFEVFGGDLKFAAIFVDGDASADNDLKAVGRLESQKLRRRAEHYDFDLGIAVFEREIKMAGIRGTEVGDLAFHPGVGVFAFDMSADGGDQVADLPYPALGRAEGESHLVREGRH